MLQNWITDSDLKRYYPKLSSQIWSTQSTYQAQIDKAYDRLIGDLYNMGINAALVMTPHDFKGGTDKNAPLVTVTETTNTTSATYESHNERRIVFNVVSGSGTLYLDGSNSTTFETIETFLVTEPDEYTSVINAPYRYFRVRSEPSATITYTAAMYETAFDELITIGALKMIFLDFTKEVGDIWSVRFEQLQKDYDNLLKGCKFYYDENESGDITTETTKKMLDITLVR